jgi:hypothetical protein
MSGNPINGELELAWGDMSIDLGGVGAYVEGTVESTDPAEPGVLLIEHVDRPGPTAVISYRLVLGSRSNRRDVWILDGNHVVFDVRTIGTSGFAGEWQASSGYTTYRSEGYACAVASS